MSTNQIVEIYKGVPVHRYNSVMLKLDEKTFKELIDAQLDTGLSIRKLLGYSATPCHHCEMKPIIAYNKEGDEVKIKRGILSKRIPATHCGTNLITQLQNRQDAESNRHCETDQ